MPLFDFRCDTCGRVESDVLIPRESPPYCHGRFMTRLIGLPAMQTWNQERRFPNLANTGDGAMTFPTKDAYTKHLKKNFLEEDHSGKIKRPHGAKVTRYA